ncbi:MAG: hypothetical protein K0S75_832 [Clostridia bacterium]|jgi:hypothetical protein|nr:hypothetical protein [Clostridia bacterium]
MTETEMMLDCYNKLQSNELYKEIVLEVPYLSRCIDMVLVDQNNEILSIEFKLKDWRKAIAQAKDHRLGADRAYICLPKPYKEVSKLLIQEVENQGIGLLLYDNESEYPFIEVVPSKSLNDRWQPWIDSLKNRINRISEKVVFER